jgi:hypothetical protein
MDKCEKCGRDTEKTFKRLCAECASPNSASNRQQAEDVDLVPMNPYEKDIVRDIAKWKAEEPSVVSEVVGIVLTPLNWLVEKVVPKAAILGVLDLSNQMAEWLSDTGDIKRDGNVTAILELRTKDLALSDRLANEVHNWAVGLATTEGAATGFWGLPGLAVDIPAIVTLALRTIYKIGICYGYESKTKADKDFILSILSIASSNTVAEKTAAVLTLRSIEVTIAKQTWKAIAERAAQQELSKEAGIIALRKLASQLGVNLTKRKAAEAIPVIGAGVGAAVNGWYIKEVGWAARRAFEERWLMENRKVFEINESKDVMEENKSKSLFDAGFRPDLEKEAKSYLNLGLLDSLKGLLVEGMEARTKTIAGRFGYLPWIGKDYSESKSAKGMKNKVFFVAESHYGSNKNWDYCDYAYIRVAEFVLDTMDKNSTYKSFFDTIDPFKQMDITLPEKKKRVFSNVVFTNICQRCMRDIKDRPTETDFINGWQTWFEAAKLLKPTLCLCDGVTSAAYFNKAMEQIQKVEAEKNGIKFSYKQCNQGEIINKVKVRRAFVIIGAHPIEIIWMRHTSSYFSPLKWRDYLDNRYRSVFQPEQNLFANWVQELNDILKSEK